MASKFPGFSSKAMGFFRRLEKNNDRDWFKAHKETFDTEVRQPMVDLVTMMCDDFRRFAVDYDEVMTRFKRSLAMVQFLNDAVLRALGDEEDARPSRPAPMF